jgi:hypothetical protein
MLDWCRQGREGELVNGLFALCWTGANNEEMTVTNVAEKNSTGANKEEKELADGHVDSV